MGKKPLKATANRIYLPTSEGKRSSYPREIQLPVRSASPSQDVHRISLPQGRSSVKQVKLVHRHTTTLKTPKGWRADRLLAILDGLVTAGQEDLLPPRLAALVDDAELVLLLNRPGADGE